MPNELTGEFDVVAQFSVSGVNRVLAGMHRAERFPHSMSLRVDDIASVGPHLVHPPLISAIDEFGEAVVDQDAIGNPVPITGEVRGLGSLTEFLDGVVNLDTRRIPDLRVEPSDLRGRAQLQISPPVIDVADSSGTKVTVKMKVLARYFPDPGSPPLSEFIRGELTITAPVTQVASEAGGIIEVDIRAATTVVQFDVQWSSAPLDLSDRAGINLFIGNALKTGFLPSNSPMPAGISHIQFKTLTGQGGAVAVMLNTTDPAGSAASHNQVFLAPGDSFGFAVGVDYVRTAFAETLERIRTEPVPPFDRTYLGYNVRYDITINDASVELANGRIRIRVDGRARTGSIFPNFNFTARVNFVLAVDGDTVNLVPGDVTLDTTSVIVNTVFKNGVVGRIREARDRALADGTTNESVRTKLSAETNLGAFLDSLLKPVGTNTVAEPRIFSLAYSFAEIRASGIVLHGVIAVADWPAPHVEFGMVPSTGSGGVGGLGIHGIVGGGPDYSALKSWIPGGTVESFEWKRQGQAGPGLVETNRFVRLDPGHLVVEDAGLLDFISAAPPLCLTIRGTRLTASGTVSETNVTATVCGYSVPIVGGHWDELEPLIALAGSGPDGMAEAYGHAPAGALREGGTAPNLVVHFSPPGTELDSVAFARALRESGRTDAAVALLNVVEPGQLERTRFVEGVTYAENIDGQWSRRFGVSPSTGPLTLIVTPFGKAVWKNEGPALEGLATALRENLSRSSPRRPPMRSARVRIGRRPPNFVFEHAAGRELTLRKLTGRNVTLVFLRGDSPPSIAALREMERTRASRDSVVLAVHDGSLPGTQKQEPNRGTPLAITIADPHHDIARAYGITMWPTIISIDSVGAVREIQYGRQGDNGPRADRSGQ